MKTKFNKDTMEILALLKAEGWVLVRAKHHLVLNHAKSPRPLILSATPRNILHAKQHAQRESRKLLSS